MEEVAIESEALGLGVPPCGTRGSGLRGDLVSELRRSTVHRIADNWMADGGHVHADLVGAAGLNADTHKREFAEARIEATNNFIVGDGGASVVCRAGGHTGAAHRIAAECCRDRSLLALDCAMHEGNVGLADLTRGKQFSERAMGCIVFGDDDEAAGVLVETVHDAGPEVAPCGRKRLETKSRALTRVLLFRASSDSPAPAWTIMPAGLLTTAKCLSSKTTSRGMSCGVALRVRVGLAGDEYVFAAAKLERSFGLRAVDRDIALIEEELHARTADALELRGDEVIEALAGGLGGDSKRNAAQPWDGLSISDNAEGDASTRPDATAMRCGLDSSSMDAPARTRTFRQPVVP